MKNFAVVLLLLAIASCGHISVDTSVPAYEANYPTAEIICDGQTFNGLAVCINPKSIQVKGYSKGSLKIDSERCELHSTVSYTNNELVDIVPSVTNTSCVINVTVSPDYNRGESTVKRVSLSGIIYLKSSLNDVTGITSKIQTSGADSFRYKTDREVRVIWKSPDCSINFDEVLKPKNGEVVTWLTDVKTNLNRKEIVSSLSQCVIEGAIVDNGVINRVSWLATFHKKEFNPLALPVVEVKDGKIKIIGDDTVAFISLNDKLVFRNKTSFDLQDGTLRLVTTAGRSVLGFVKGEKITWAQ